MLNLLSCERKHGEELDHYLYNDVRHQRGKRDRSVDFKALEEISKAFEQVHERIVARADTDGSLMDPDIRKMRDEDIT